MYAVNPAAEDIICLPFDQRAAKQRILLFYETITHHWITSSSVLRHSFHWHCHTLVGQIRVFQGTTRTF